MSEKRLAMVEGVFQSIDANQNGELDIEEIKAMYTVNKHPDVLQGVRSEETVLAEFYETLTANHAILNDSPDGVVSQSEFIEYYKNISFLIDKDNEFFDLLRHTWNCVPRKEPSPKKTKTPALTSPTEVEFRENHKKQYVMRQGKQSDENPLFLTKDYYPKTDNARVGNVTNQ